MVSTSVCLLGSTAPFSSSSPLSLGICQACGDQCFLVLDCAAAVFSLQWCAVGLCVVLNWAAVRSASGLLLTSCLGVWISFRDALAGRSFSLFKIFFAGNQLSFWDVHVACKCTVSAILIECIAILFLIQTFCQLRINPLSLL